MDVNKIRTLGYLGRRRAKDGAPCAQPEAMSKQKAGSAQSPGVPGRGLLRVQPLPRDLISGRLTDGEGAQVPQAGRTPANTHPLASCPHPRGPPVHSHGP